MTTEEEILESLAICDNLPSYDDFEQVVSDIHELSDKLDIDLPAEEEKEKRKETADNEVAAKPMISEEINIPAEPIVPVAASSANVKYDEVTRPIPTVKGVPIVSPPIEQPVEEKEETKEAVSVPENLKKEEAVPVSESTKREEEAASVSENAEKEEQTVSETENIKQDTQDETLPENDSKEGKGKEILRGILGLLVCIAAALLISVLITHFVAHHTHVEGSSMESSLHDGDEIIVEKVSYYMHDPERYDIIVFPFSDNVYYIKRIIGLPGETIQIKDGKIYIDGVQLWEQYGNEQIKDAGLAKEEIVLGKDEYFVLGDNRNSSIDSRKAEVGTVKRSEIIGKAWLKFYPFSDFGFLQHQQ